MSRTADLSTPLRSGRDDNSVATSVAIFIPLGEPQAHDLSGRDDKLAERSKAGFYWKEGNYPQSVCHLDRSEASWRDLRFYLISCYFSMVRTTLNLALPSVMRA